MNVLISIIIPVYNVEDYLERCLDSIIHQSYKNIEIIVINDGSTDSSLKILEKYALKNSRIIIVNQENKGLSGARNIGVEKAIGDYIWFVDGDDFIDNDACERLISFVEKENQDLDILVFGKKDEYLNNKSISLPKKICQKKYLSGQEYFKENIRNGNYRTNVCDKWVRRKLITDNNLTFVNGKLYEDMLFSLKMFMYAANTLVVPIYPYHYVHYNPNSITTLIRRKDLDVLFFVDEAYSFLRCNHFDISEKSLEFNILIFNWVSATLLNKYVGLSFKHKDAMYIFNKVIANIPFNESVYCCSRNNCGLRKRFFACILRLSPFVYRIILYLALKIQRFVY